MGIYKRGSVYWMNYTWQGKQIRKPCRTTNRTEAQKLYEESDPRNKLTFDDLIIWYLNHPIPKRRKTYLRFREMTVKLCDYFEGRLVEDIKPVDVERFQDWMLNSPTFKGTPYKPKTVNLHVALLKRMFNLAVRDELVNRNPCWKVAHLPVRNVRDRIVSPSEFEALKDALPQYSLILTLGYFLGMRRGEILTLKDSQVHFSNGAAEGYIHLVETKNGEERLIPFNGEIGELLKKQLTKTRDGRLFYPRWGKSVDAGFRIAFDRACKRLGIEGLCFHDFRHTSVTNMRKAGVDTSVIMAISGHKTLAMFQRYNKVDMGDKMVALSILNQYLGVRYEPHALTD